jgi:hypothetical protein
MGRNERQAPRARHRRVTATRIAYYAAAAPDVQKIGRGGRLRSNAYGGPTAERAASDSARRLRYFLAIKRRPRCSVMSQSLTERIQSKRLKKWPGTKAFSYVKQS